MICWFCFVRRDFVTVYIKQTILLVPYGFIQPLLTTITFTIIFLETWRNYLLMVHQKWYLHVGNYPLGIFSTCLTTVSGVFNANADYFWKVYFPRLIIAINDCDFQFDEVCSTVFIFYVLWFILLYKIKFILIVGYC